MPKKQQKNLHDLYTNENIKIMKTNKFLALCFFLMTSSLFAQDFKTMAFIDVDTRGTSVSTSSNPVSIITRIELEKTKKFQLLDNYDLEYIMKRDTLSISNCYSRLCLTEIGKKLKVSKMFTGSIIVVGENIIITFKILDVESGNFEKTQVSEFLNIPLEIKSMVAITMNSLFGIANDETLVSKLTKRNDFDNSINNPYQLQLKADGPRMGFTYFTGDAATVLKAKRSEGGYDAAELMFQFGYQFEKQYLNEGNFQALFEFIPTITGLDQGIFIPSFTFMNGIRNNKNGWEFAFGPTFSFVKKAEGFYNSENKWVLRTDSSYNNAIVKPATEFKVDSRGDLNINAGFIMGFGKTIKSGKMNMPINGYVIPNSSGVRFGISFGFNSRERYSYNPQ